MLGSSTIPRRARCTSHSRSSWHSLPSCIQVFFAQGRAVGRLDPGCSRRVLRGVSVPLLQRAGDPAGSANGNGHDRRAHRRGNHARGDAPCDGHGHADHHRPVSHLYFCRAADARSDSAQGRDRAAVRVAYVAHHRRRLRCGARRVGAVHLPVRAVRHAARHRRRGQLHDAGFDRAARASARRSGKGGRGVFRAQRHRVRLIRFQRGIGRHLHDPAHEAHRLLRRQGGRDRGGLVDQWPAHAAGDGRRGLPDGRVRRHPLCGDLQARGAAGDHLVHRALLHRASRGVEIRPQGDSARLYPDCRAARARLGARRERHTGGLRGDLLRHQPRALGIRRRRLLGACRPDPGHVCGVARLLGAVSRRSARRSARAGAAPAQALAHDTRRHAFFHSHSGAALVPDGRRVVPRHFGVLGHGDRDRAGCRAARAAGDVPAHRPGRGRPAQRGCATCGKDSCSARAA